MLVLRVVLHVCCMCVACVLHVCCMYLGCLLYNRIEPKGRLQTDPCPSHYNAISNSLIANPNITSPKTHQNSVLRTGPRRQSANWFCKGSKKATSQGSCITVKQPNQKFAWCAIFFETLPGFFKKNSHPTFCVAPLSILPLPPFLNVVCVLHAAETQMAVFFEALPAQIRNTTLKLGRGGF